METEKDGTEVTDAERTSGLEKELAEKNLALREALARIAGMENETKVQREEITALKSRGDTANSELEIVKGSLADAVKCYRELVIAANPELPAELIGGETVAILNESLTKAKGLVGRVWQVIEAESAKTRVPAGSPGRITADINTLSAREKIARGIGKE